MPTALPALGPTVVACALVFLQPQVVVKELRIPSHAEGDWTLQQLLDEYGIRSRTRPIWDDETLTLAQDVTLGLVQPETVSEASLDSFVSAMLHIHGLATLTFPDGGLRIVFADASQTTVGDVLAAERLAASRSPCAEWTLVSVPLQHLSAENAARWLPEVWPVEVRASGTSLLLEGPRAFLFHSLQLLSAVDHE